MHDVTVMAEKADVTAAAKTAESSCDQNGQ